MDCSPPGSSVLVISQARKLEWVAISFSRRSSWSRDRASISCISRWILYHWATSSVQLLSCIWLFVTPWHSAQQAALPTLGACSNSCLSSWWCHPTSHPLSSPSPPAFNLSQHDSFPVSQFFTSGGQNIGVSASASDLSMNIQDWFPLGWTGWISLQSRDPQESSPTPQFKSISSLALSFLYGPTLTLIRDYWKNHSFDQMDFCLQSNVSAF